MHIPKDLMNIMPRIDQVWNVDEIRLYPDGKWYRIVCTYKWYNVDRVLKTQEGEHELFWFTLIFLTGADGQYFISSTVIHNEKIELVNLMP